MGIMPNLEGRIKNQMLVVNLNEDLLNSIGIEERWRIAA